jgi:hypothetical protein
LARSNARPPALMVSSFTASATLPALAAGAALLPLLLLGICRAAAAGERRLLGETLGPLPPRTAHEVVAAALVALDVEHATLFAADAPDRLRILARGHLGVRADGERVEVHVEAAAAALDTRRTAEFGGAAPAPLVAAAPVFLRGRAVGALAVSSWSTQRGRLTFAHRRALRELVDAAAALPELEPHRPASISCLARRVSRATRAKPSAIAALARPARRRPARAPGRESAGDADHTASVAISVPRSHASAHQSCSVPRRAASVCAAAKVSQIGPQRRKRCSASRLGLSWPSSFRVARGASRVPEPSARSKAAITTFQRLSASASVIGGDSNSVL